MYKFKLAEIIISKKNLLIKWVGMFFAWKFNFNWDSMLRVGIGKSCFFFFSFYTRLFLPIDIAGIFKLFCHSVSLIYTPVGG